MSKETFPMLDIACLSSLTRACAKKFFSVSSMESCHVEPWQVFPRTETIMMQTRPSVNICTAAGWLWFESVSIGHFSSYVHGRTYDCIRNIDSNGVLCHSIPSHWWAFSTFFYFSQSICRHDFLIFAYSNLLSCRLSSHLPFHQLLQIVSLMKSLLRDILYCMT